MVTFYGLSEKQRLKEYAKDPKKHKYKPFINCLRDEDCRECKDRTNCAIIEFKKMRGYKRDNLGNWIKPRRNNPSEKKTTRNSSLKSQS